MKEPDVAARLVVLGWEPDEAAVFVELCRRGPTLARHLAEHLGVSRPRIYRALDGLLGHGWATQTLERPSKFHARPVAEVLADLAATKEAEVQAVRESATDIATALAAPPSPGKATAGDTRFAIVRGASDSAKWARRLVSKATRTIDAVFSTAFPVPPQAAKPIVHELRTAAGRGVRVRILIRRTGAWTHDPIGEARTGTLDVRLLETEDPVGLLLVDQRETLLGLEIAAGTPGPRGPPAFLWTNAPALHTLQSISFGAMWERAERAEPRAMARTTVPLEKRRPG